MTTSPVHQSTGPAPARATIAVGARGLATGMFQWTLAWVLFALCAAGADGVARMAP